MKYHILEQVKHAKYPVLTLQRNISKIIDEKHYKRFIIFFEFDCCKSLNLHTFLTSILSQLCYFDYLNKMDSICLYCLIVVFENYTFSEFSLWPHLYTTIQMRLWEIANETINKFRKLSIIHIDNANTMLCVEGRKLFIFMLIAANWNW